jgi:hypothetical protein
VNKINLKDQGKKILFCCEFFCVGKPKMKMQECIQKHTQNGNNFNSIIVPSSLDIFYIVVSLGIRVFLLGL